MPAIKFPNLPSIDLTKFDLSGIITNLHLPMIRPEPVVQLIKDSAYVTIGVGVLAFQKVQVRRREIAETVQASLPKIATEAVVQTESIVRNMIAFVNARLANKSVPTAQ